MYDEATEPFLLQKIAQQAVPGGASVQNQLLSQEV